MLHNVSAIGASYYVLVFGRVQKPGYGSRDCRVSSRRDQHTTSYTIQRHLDMFSQENIKGIRRPSHKYIVRGRATSYAYDVVRWSRVVQLEIS